jgi:hypothetical protein
MMGEMMKECCGKDGMPDFGKMKDFMEKCGKREFTGDEIRMMRQFCGQIDKPDIDKMKQLMEKCGCSSNTRNL